MSRNRKDGLRSLLKNRANFNRVARSLLEQRGLDYALAFFFAQIGCFKPLRHIHCVMRNMADATRIALGEWGCDISIITASEADVFTRMGGAWDNFEAYIATDVEEDPIFRNFYNSVMQYHSMVRVLLFEKNGYRCFLGLWARDREVFGPADLEVLQSLLAPFGECLKNMLDTDPVCLSRRRQPSSFAALSMCRGLREQTERMRNIAATDSAVLITGETGCGKGEVAKAIHELSPRASRPFVVVNCGAIPESLLESELFGHERGSFTGALTGRPGLFEQADGGTVFLDEIAEMPLSGQGRLLHVLDSHTVTRVGGRSMFVDMRVIAATNRDLRRMVGQGLFREDLFYRLNVYPIRIPPLRERREDIVPLVHHFLVSKTAEMGIDAAVLPSSREADRLRGYDWPGNVRELEHAVERAILDARRGSSMLRPHFELGSENIPVDEEDWGTAEDVLRRYMVRVLRRTGGRIYGPGGAAALLGMHPMTVRAKMKKFGIGVERVADVRSLSEERIRSVSEGADESVSCGPAEQDRPQVVKRKNFFSR